MSDSMVMTARPQWWEVERAVLAMGGRIMCPASIGATVVTASAVVHVHVDVASQDVERWTEGGREYEMRVNQSYRVTATSDDGEAARQVLDLIRETFAEFVVSEVPSLVTEYAKGCVALQRRIDAGEPDDDLDPERERLAAVWLSLTEEERAAVEGG